MTRNLVNLEAVSKTWGTRTLLDGVSLGVAEGQRTGVVGRNGGGKTTLLEVMTGLEPPDAGRVTHAGDLALGVLAQHDDLPADATVRDVVVGGAAAHEWAGDPRVRDVLVGLFGGLDLPGLPHGMDSPVRHLSGGERRRVALARLLVGEHDLLVLDEPTNHLDVEGIAWLARHVRARRGGLVVVTHDRWFLDEVCDTTWEVADGRVHAYEGGYSAYVLARAERERVAAADEQRRQNLLRKELAWLRRGPPARTSKPRFRIDAANALIADEPPARDSVELVRFASARLGRTVYEVHDATLRVGGRDLLARLTWDVGPGQRIGVVGVNGAGKTSLLRMLLGLLPPAEGRVVTGVTVKAAYLSQQVSELPPALRVLEAVEQVKRVMELGGGRTMTASQLCERFGFTGDKQWTPVGDLSGGERRRLQLLRLLMDEPNVLVLDEPTNDLDIETLTALEDLLDGWAGTLLVVSHDRYFLERTCDTTVALLGDGRLRDLVGGVEEYLARREEAAGAASRPGAGAGGGPAAAAPQDGPVGPSAQDVRQARKDLSRVERRLDRIAAEEARLHEQIAAAATDYERVAGLDAQLRALAAEREALEEEWLAAAEVAG
ncbi:ABC-F family ATP-binding cassette domain-containing protein [Vallicoccus soli]|uniref:ABC transporter ATP-binding protein n=1 Tax=Vallicoccus soli TaxID=2339232 RepID=A0A3A3Z9U1_9ACTN|nr:ABC-F family ATP-binding cassette domain-containing protein [Vallicoccus soli]RJK97856.1 ABC transporter ATP-binding protein [Vallicoccus soli]